MSLYKKFLAAQFTGVTTGNLNLTGSLYQNGSPYIASQWTTTGGNVSYTTGNVVIGGDLTTGNLNLTGSLYQNGAPYIASQWTTTGGDISYTTGSVIATNATLTNATINNYIMTNLTTGNLVANNLNLGMSNVFSGSFLAGNNVASATDVTGLAFDNATVRSFIVTLTVNITITNGVNLYETFTIEGTQASTGWQLAIESMGDTTNVGFTITSSGQVRYTSPDLGANWSQTVFRYTATQISNTGTFAALSSATNGSYIINSVQINSTTDAVAGVNNGVLYVLGGATVAKNLNAGSVSAANIAVSSLTAGNLRVPGTLTVTNITVNNLIQSSGSIIVTGNNNTIGSLVMNSAGNVTVSGDVVVSGTVSSGTGFMFRNKIINGDMRIDQRGSASSAVSANASYGPDRFYVGSVNLNGTLSIQQASVPAALTGFQKCLKITGNSVSLSNAVTGYGIVGQGIEGQNIGDLAWGTASAKSVTVSFWVYSNATATYSFSLTNNTDTNYVSNYTINSVNTWQKVIITIPGPTSGTWATDINMGILCRWSFVSGSSFLTTQNTWFSGSTKLADTAGISNIGSNTVYITGVQFEQGTISTPFEFRPYSVELLSCQRFYQEIPNNNGQRATGNGRIIVTNNGSNLIGGITIPVVMRTEPGSVVFYGGNSTTNNITAIYSSNSGSQTAHHGAASSYLTSLKSACMIGFNGPASSITAGWTFWIDLGWTAGFMGITLSAEY